MEKISTPMKRNDMVERALDIRYKSQRAKYFLKWGAIYAILLSFILFDVLQKCQNQLYTTLYWIECVSGMVVALSLFICFGKYLFYVVNKSTVHGTVEQKNLLSFCDNDKSFVVKTAPANVPKTVEPDSNRFVISWHSSFSESFGRSGQNWCLNRTSAARAGQYSPQKQQPQQQLQQQSLSSNQSQQPQYSNNLSWDSSIGNSSLNYSTMSTNGLSSPYKHYTAEDIIDDDESLQQYLKEFNKREAGTTEITDINNAFNMSTGNSFWNYCNTAANFLLKTSIYQLAPATTPTTQNKQNIDDTNFQFVDANSEVIKGISSEKLSQYVANLRVWISTTILKRLVREIKNIDDVFKSRGLFDMQIGTVGLERLRKTAEMPEIIELMPKLSVILPFLSLTNNQEYLVQRIKDLANGACIADYRWNSGSSYNGDKWDEHLPTDAAILFHLFCIYLDCQLLPLPQGGGRPFSSRYVVMSDEVRSPKEVIAAVNNKAQCAIYCVNTLKPKFNFISEKQIHNCSYNRNNLFYVIIQFLIYMKTHQDSLLEGVNLGKTGMNIMCVIEE